MNAKEKKRHCAELITKHYVKSILKTTPQLPRGWEGSPSEIRTETVAPGGTVML